MLYPIELRAHAWDLRGASDYNGNSRFGENLPIENAAFVIQELRISRT
jgi:hypothetical protein